MAFAGVPKAQRLLPGIRSPGWGLPPVCPGARGMGLSGSEPSVLLLSVLT